MLEISISQHYFMYGLLHVEKCLICFKYCELVSTVIFIFFCIFAFNKIWKKKIY